MANQPNGSSAAYTHTLDAGSTLNVERDHIQWIRNDQNHPIQVEVTNLLSPGTTKWVQLPQSGAQDPPIGNYFGSVTLHNVQCAEDDAYDSADAMVEALKDAVPLSELMAGLASVFGLSEEEMADLLLNHGFPSDVIAQVLRESFLASVEDLIAVFDGLGFDVVEMAAIILEGLGGAGDLSEDLAGHLFDLGYSAGEVLSVLDLTPQGALDLLVRVGFGLPDAAAAVVEGFGVAGGEISGWLYEMGVSPEAAAEALAAAFDLGAAELAAWMDEAGYAVDAVLAGLSTLGLLASGTFDALMQHYQMTADQLKTALDQAGIPGVTVEEWLASLGAIELVTGGHTQGFAGNPIATPLMPFPIRRGVNLFTIKGAALNFITAVNGFPGGETAEIVGQSARTYQNAAWTYAHIRLVIPENTRPGTGEARVFVASSGGPTFLWELSEAATESSGTLPKPGQGTNGDSSGDPVDLVPLQSQNVFYRLGTATTLDDDGDDFVALEPFNGSPFCQGIPEGEVSRGQLPSSNTDRIVVPDVRWGVENASGVDLAGSFVIELRRGGTVVASEEVRGLRPGAQAEFTYRRPSSSTVVARVGTGNGCYHAGLASEGWNDNPGYTVHVDVRDDVRESRENNNTASLINQSR